MALLWLASEVVLPVDRAVVFALPSTAIIASILHSSARPIPYRRAVQLHGALAAEVEALVLQACY